jgi:hypothetical protein
VLAKIQTASEKRQFLLITKPSPTVPIAIGREKPKTSFTNEPNEKANHLSFAILMSVFFIFATTKNNAPTK